MRKTPSLVWLTVPAAADYIGSSEPAFRRLLRDGVVPYSKPGGKAKSRIRVKRSDLDRLMAANYTDATTGPLAH